MGAIVNLAPGRFAGIVAQVPFVDALNSILDPSLPLTVTEWEEWGDPLHDPAVYAYMKSYTPYENVAPAAYPAIFALTSLNDTRVLYHEPAKWTARLRAAASGGPFLLKTEMEAGHGGRSGRYDAWQEEALVLAWIVATATGSAGLSGGPGGRRQGDDAGQPALTGSFSVERALAAPPDRVFAAYADPDCGGAGCGFPATRPAARHELDFRPGGHEVRRGRFAPPGVAGTEELIEYRAVFWDIMPGTRLVFGYELALDGVRRWVSLVTVELSAAVAAR